MPSLAVTAQTRAAVLGADIFFPAHGSFLAGNGRKALMRIPPPSISFSFSFVPLAPDFCSILAQAAANETGTCRVLQARLSPPDSGEKVRDVATQGNGKPAMGVMKAEDEMCGALDPFGSSKQEKRDR